MTKPERVLWRALREALPQHHWRKQVPLGDYFADFASHSARLIVEVDGGQHATTKDRDAQRKRFLETQGYRVLCFWNNDGRGNTAGVLERIAEAMSTSPYRAFGAHPSPAARGREAQIAGRVRL